jgi:hypothetical protein
VFWFKTPHYSIAPRRRALFGPMAGRAKPPEPTARKATKASDQPSRFSSLAQRDLFGKAELSFQDPGLKARPTNVCDR